MEFNGRYVIAAPPWKVWDGINDPAILKACIPGCEQLDKTSPTEFVAAVRLTELEPPQRCRLSGEGQGGVAGFAKGEAQVELTPDGDGTVLTYAAKASVGGKLAQIGQRLIDGAARQIADDFFKRFQAALGAPALSPDPPVETAAMPPAAPMSSETVRRGVSPAIWVAGLIAVVAILLLAFGLRF
jgi:carbon monoxide dehydrogenase subunit G